MTDIDYRGMYFKLSYLEELDRDPNPIAKLALALDTSTDRARRIHHEATVVADRDQYTGGTPWAWVGRWGRYTAQRRLHPDETAHVTPATRMLRLARQERYGARLIAAMEGDLRHVRITGTLSVGDAARLDTVDGTWETFDRSSIAPRGTLPIHVGHGDQQVGVIDRAKVDTDGSVTFYGFLDDPRTGENLYFGDLDQASWRARTAIHPNGQHRNVHRSAQLVEMSLTPSARVMGAKVEFAPVPDTVQPLALAFQPPRPPVRAGASGDGYWQHRPIPPNRIKIR